jgi:rhodanese-related sulfurtransferase
VGARTHRAIRARCDRESKPLSSSRPRVDDDAEAHADGLQTEAYCSNTACRNSEIVANELISLGYGNVRTYAEGKQAWTEAGLEL